MAQQGLHQLDNQPQKEVKISKPVTPQKWTGIMIVLLIVILAVVTGRMAAKWTSSSSQDLPQVTYTQEGGGLGSSYGQKNEKLCPDKATGTMKQGGIDGEGTHHLVRKGGKDQYVYLTSSTVDLSLLENKNVQVWGKTYAAKTAGWLMDVCYLEVK